MKKVEMKPVTETVQVEVDSKALKMDRDVQTVLGNEMAKEPMMIEIQLGLTKQLKKYESAKITITLSGPTSEETLEVDYDRRKAWIENKISQEVESINKALAAMENESGSFDI